jgi:hypothetical protein
LYLTGLGMLQNGVSRNSREFLDLDLALHRELGLRPWHHFIFDLDPDDDTPDPDDMRSRQHAHVRDLLRQLVQAIAADEPAHKDRRIPASTPVPSQPH